MYTAIVVYLIHSYIFINIFSSLFIFYDLSHKRLTTKTLRILSNYSSNYFFNL